MHDPSAEASGPLPTDRMAEYALITWGPGGAGTARAPYWRWPGPPLGLAAVARPAETIQWMDGWTTSIKTVALILRHTGGTNVALVDGHVRWLPMVESRRVSTDGRGYCWYTYETADR